MGPPMSGQGSHQGDYGLFSFDQCQFDPLAEIGGGPMADNYNNTPEQSTRFQGPNFGTVESGVPAFQHATQQMTSQVDSILTSPMSHHSRIPSINFTQYEFNSQQPTFDQVQQEDRPVKRQRTSSVSEPQDGLNALRTEDGHYRCKVCRKVRRRECDLR